MMKSIFSRAFFTVVVSAFVLTACDKDEARDAEGATLLSSNETVLRYIPADTPYVFASVEPLPDDLMDKMEPKLGRLMQSYQTILREAVAAKSHEMPNEEEAEKIQAFVDELAGLISIEGLREAGIGREATGAIYGHGLLPVIRLDQVDGALLDAAIARLEEKAGHKLPVASIEGGGYRYLEGKEGRLIIAVFSDQLVIALAPEGFGDDQVSQLLGLTLPDSSIADAGVLETVASEYGFTPHYAGFVDVEALASAFIDAPTGLNADLMALAQHDATTLSDVCKAEIRLMAGAVPKLVMGYTEISTDRLDSTVVLELRDDLAAGMQTLSSAIPGLGEDRGGLMSFGFGLDVRAAREFLESRVEAMEAEPFQCEHFADLQKAADGARVGLQQPLPPMAYDFKGMLAVINDIEGLEVATQTPPTSIDGSFLLAMDNAPALVSMGAMFSPEIGALGLEPDGVPVALDLMQLQAAGLTAHAALTESALAIAVGEASEADIEAMLSASVPDEAPFLSFSMDAGRYYTFIGEAIAAGPQQGENGPSPEMQAALQDVMNGVGALYDRMSVDVLFTSNGVEFRTSVTLQD